MSYSSSLEALPDAAPSAGHLLIYRDERTCIHRIAHAGGSIICKEGLGADAQLRVRHETRILERLAGVEGVPRVASVPVTGIGIALHDSGGTSLAEVLLSQKPSVPELVDLALRLARIAAEVHRRGVVHKDINPGNILVADAGRTVTLIDYDLATTFAEDRPAFVHHREIAGTLAYLAPEQTGRTGRTVDYRADLYALGATLYELAVGRPPFSAADPLQLIHDHLARLPIPPATADPRVPPALSAIIMRLLEKEPERRYQSADGLAHDLARLREHLARGERAEFPLGQRDFPLRLAPPSRLFGRAADIAAITRAFERALQGQHRCVLVAGAPGVGKTALIDELRPLVTARRGWFLTGKFDQYHHDTSAGAVVQVLRALGRMLLAEPEAELQQERTRIAEALGPRAGLLTAIVPECGILLGDVPAVSISDPIEAESQLRLASLSLLRAVTSPARPLVIVLDDLQWAYPSSLRFLDDAVMDETISGLLLAGAYRESDLDPAHLLAVMLTRWQRLGRAPEVLRPGNLGPQDLAGLIAEMLRLAPVEALRLAGALSSRTHGNPYDTIELVNALRRDGLLEPAAHGWTWDAMAIRRYVGHGEVVNLVASRLARLPIRTRRLLQTMACLGGNVGLDLLQVATGLSATALEDRLAPALEDGLLVIDRGERLPAGNDSVRFRHDRVQQAAHEGLAPVRRQMLHLAVARRLARVPEHTLKAAEQYLSALDAVRDAREQRQVIALLQAAAGHGHRTANFAVVERFLAGAMRLLAGDAIAADDPVREVVEKERHLALYSLGRLDEADALYQAIARRCSDPMDLVDATAVQVNSLFNRGRPRDAVDLGLGLLERLGLAVPSQAENEIARRLHEFQVLIAPPADQPDDVARAAASDPRVLAIAKLMLHVATPAYFAAPAIRAWLLLECRRLWSEHGPCAALLYNLAVAPFATIGWGDDYRTGYEVARHAVRVGTARAFEPETSRARHGFAFFAAPWFEPLEVCVEEARQAREGLLQAGDVYFAAMSFTTTMMVMFDCAVTLDDYEMEVEAALTLAARTGNDHAAAICIQYRQTVRALRGATPRPGSLSDASFDEAAHFARVARNPAVAVTLHSLIAVTALIFRDRSRLAHHGAEAMQLRAYVIGQYRSALVRWTRAIALAELIRGAAPDEGTALRAELADCRNWMARRAQDAPFNFQHLMYSIDAEIAWAEGDRWGAATAFDIALREAARHRRPWHLAVIAERAALFHLGEGLDHVGRQLLAQSRAAYAAWGASGKVEALDREHPFLRAGEGRGRPAAARGAAVSSDAIDLVAVLRASQALSSETSLDRLQVRIVELLGAMTGATGVSVALWHDDPPGWQLARPAGALPVDDAGARRLLPVAALRYAERTREPLLVDDAVRDGRFAGDPYLAGLDCCSLLVVPILSHGAPRAMLFLENRLGRGAFTTDRLEAVTLIAGQLAVSFDNALLYASLERKVAERTRALEEVNGRLALLSITDPLTGLANRRRFAETLEAEWARALRMHGALALVLIDVDHFKLFNDRYGHVAGDVCLRKVAGALGEGVRAGSDLVARYGGEEFAVILPGVDARMAQAMAERLRAAVAALAEPHAGAAAGIVTVSAGVAAVLPSSRTTAEQLIRAADAALYEAKGSGRNQVRVAPVDASALSGRVDTGRPPGKRASP